MTTGRNWRVETDDSNRICRLTLDKSGGSYNLLSTEVIAELDSALAEIEQADPAALLICSAKASGFIAGADVTEFISLETRQQAEEMLAAAHRVLRRLAALNMPTVALINGHCLGGGLELALACDYRVACDRPQARIGLPEVTLGIHPGFGGSVRLIETIGARAALPFMLRGQVVTPRAAARLGIVDFAVPPRQLQRTAHHIIAKRPPRRRATRWQKLQNLAPLRLLLAEVLRRKTAARVDPANYPAPFRLIELWRQHGGNRADMLAAEQTSVARLLMTSTARNLVRVFHLRQTLTRIGKHKNNGASTPATHVHIVGGGVMGGDIAAWCAVRGLRATLHDPRAEAVAAATRRAHALFRRKLESKWQVQRAMDRFEPDLAGHGARRADVVIEAIIEDADAKIAVLAELQKIARPDALLVTNTSSIPLEILGNALSAPGRLAGLHFFNPVAKMPLVEIVTGSNTYGKTANRAAAFAVHIGRLPLPVQSGPGFLVNRVLAPYLLEAIEMREEGVPSATIDRAATAFGMPMGPIALADSIGLDICLRVVENLRGQSGEGGGDDGGNALAALRQRVEAGKLGKKSGEGFYKWRKGRPQQGWDWRRIRSRIGRTATNSADIENRLIFRFLNEAVACLREGVVEEADLLDAGLIFGTGFAPFRGGPIRHITEQGVDEMLGTLNDLRERYGDRFKPGAGWGRLRSAVD